MGVRTVVGVFLIAGAAGLALVVANAGVTFVEERAEIDVRSALDENGFDWAEVDATGLAVRLSGTAPDEALRFDALAVAGHVVDSARLVDAMETQAVADLPPPRFSLEVLRNGAGLSIIGLVPADTDRVALAERLNTRMDVPVTDLLETADHPAPSGWIDAMGFALAAVERLPRAKISAEAGRVEITAMATTATEKTELEAALRGAAPPALDVALDIMAPRPVISPFTLRFVLDEAGARFDACAADTDAAAEVILGAATRAGLQGQENCTVALGAPTPAWAEAASTAIDAVVKLSGGTVTLRDADVSLIAVEGTDPALFDRVVGELETALPAVFALKARLPMPDGAPGGPEEFVATRSPEGYVQLRGRLSDARMRDIAESYARARFGSADVYVATRLTDGLPEDWSTRVLAGIEALGYLDSGAMTVSADRLTLSGRSGDDAASDAVARMLADKLGPAAGYSIDIAFVPPRPPEDQPPSPEECEAELAGIVSVAKINFEPGSATIDAAAVGTMDDIAEVLATCGDLKLEVQGHTDSQGREQMNLALSQARAESVLNELRARQVLTANFTAKGYGEANPIADNGTEEGREANRRIEFRLIQSELLVEESKTTLESLAENGDTETGETAGQPADAAE